VGTSSVPQQDNSVLKQSQYEAKPAYHIPQQACCKAEEAHFATE